MDLWALVLSVFHSLSNAVGGDAVALIVTVGFVFALVVLWRVHAAIVATEFYKKYKEVWDLVDDKLADLIFLVEFGDVDLEPWREKAKQRELAGEPYVDPRMLFVVDKVQADVSSRYGIDIDFLSLYARATHIFDEVKNDPSNGVGELPSVNK